MVCKEDIISTLANWLVPALYFDSAVLRTAFSPLRQWRESACYPRPSLLGMWSSRSAEGRKSALAHKDRAYLGWLTVKHGRRTLRWRRRRRLRAGGVDIPFKKPPSCPPHAWSFGRLWIPRPYLSSARKSGLVGTICFPSVAADIPRTSSLLLF